MDEAAETAAGTAVLEISPFDRHCGLRLLEAGEERVLAEVPVRPHLLQPTGVVHGGVYATIGEAIASLGSNHAAHPRGAVALGMTNSTSFVRPIGAGTIHAEATRLHLGSTSAVWDVRMSDDAGRLCAVSRVTLALRQV
ncbi:MAG: PaaI family thioesterase [Actinobacteria bacterium]|nr:PaaI family thioesterase [Actinomycetota bacterium]